MIRGSQSTFPNSLSSLMLSKETVPDGSLTSRRAMSLPVRESVPTSNSISSERGREGGRGREGEIEGEREEGWDEVRKGEG